MRPQTTITIPTARAEQLQALAATEGTTVAELVEVLINRAITDARLPDVLPGFPVLVKGRRVAIAILGYPLVPIAPPQARQVADALDSVAARHPGKGITIGDDLVQVARIGRGIVVAAGKGGSRTVRATMTPAMARDFARQIRTAADQAATS